MDSCGICHCALCETLGHSAQLRSDRHRHPICLDTSRPLNQPMTSNCPTRTPPCMSSIRRKGAPTGQFPLPLPRQCHSRAARLPSSGLWEHPICLDTGTRGQCVRTSWWSLLFPRRAEQVTSRMTSSAFTQTASQPLRAPCVFSGRRKMTRPGGTSSSMRLRASIATLYLYRGQQGTGQTSIAMLHLNGGQQRV